MHYRRDLSGGPGGCGQVGIRQDATLVQFWDCAEQKSPGRYGTASRANARLLYPNPPRTKVQIQGFFASLRMTKFDGGYSNPEFALKSQKVRARVRAQKRTNHRVEDARMAVCGYSRRDRQGIMEPMSGVEPLTY